MHWIASQERRAKRPRRQTGSCGPSPWALMHQLDDMKTCAALPALAAGATAAMIVVMAPLQAKDSFQPRDCPSVYCASIVENATSSSGLVRLADDYCNTRCDQQFNYCQYRRESRDHCARWLINCRRNC
jgi:hypothetical protein